MGRLALALALSAAAVGCGDNQQEVPAEPVCSGQPPVFEEPEGLLTDPAELLGAECDPSTLADVDVTGLWLEQAEEGFSFGALVELARDCDVLTQLGVDEAFELFVSESESGIFLRREATFGESTITFGTNLCRANPDGSLLGYQSICRAHPMFGEMCFGVAPVRLDRFDRLDEPESEGLSLLAAWRGDESEPWAEGLETNVRVTDGIAYITRGEDGLRIVDVSAPTEPVDLGHFPTDEGDFFNDLKLVDGPGGTRYALIASGLGVLSIDVTDPRAPALAAVFSDPGQFGMHTLFTETIDQRTLAYLADGGSPILGIFDVTDPANPVQVGQFVVPDEWAIHDLSVDQGRVYLNATLGGMFAVDTLPDPSNPVLVGNFVPDEFTYSHSNWTTEVAGRKIAVHGDEGATAHVRIVDVDPASPEFMQEIGEFRMANNASVHNIMAFGDRAYVAWYQNGIRVLDLSDPTAPRQIAHFNTWEHVTGSNSLFQGTLGLDVDLAAGILYAADSQLGLVILRIDE